MDRYEMNDYQKTIMNIELTYPGTPTCSVGGVMYFCDDIDIELVARAIEEYIAVTPAIRLRIGRDGGMYLSDEIVSPVKLLSTEGEAPADIVDKLMQKPLDLYDAPLYRVTYFMSESGWIGALQLHHVLADNTALTVFNRCVERIYRDMKKGVYERLAPDMRYIESMVNGGNVGDHTEAREYYGERFKKYAETVRTVRLRSSEAGLISREVGEEMSEMILDFCRDNSVKIESVIYAALAVYKKSTTGDAVSVFGRTLMNRHIDELDIFGLYANTVPVFIRADGSFADTAAAAEKELDESAAFSDYSIGRMLSDNGIGERCYDIAVSFISLGMLPKLKIASTDRAANGHIELPMRIHIFRRKRRIRIDMEYAKEIYSDDDAEAFIGSLMNIMRTGMEGGNVSCLSDADKKAYAALNDVKYVNADTTVSRLFSEYAAGHAEETAVICGGETLSFGEVDRLANAVAVKVTGCKLVGIAAVRSKYLVPAMLGVLKAGAAYMPLEPSLPVPKECDIVLSLSSVKGSISKCILLDRQDYSYDKYTDRSEPEQEAYRMRTSGSTGVPKTVRISNKSLLIRLKWMDETIGLKRRILQKTNATFDVSGWELLCGAFGGCCVLPEQGAERDLDMLCRYINKYKIEMIHFVPSVLRLFLRHDSAENLKTLKTVISSGEALDVAAVKAFCDKLPDAELYNLYGPTECTIDVTSCRCGGDDAEISIGKPVYNTAIHIVTPAGEAAPRGVRGEIVVTGDLVGMGYAENVPGYGMFDGKRAYYTGDIGYLGFDGNIYFCGRNDSQVKINGKRTDLAGLERLILGIEGVTGAAVICGGGGAVAYYSAESPIDDIIHRLSAVTDRLPSAAVYVKEMPMTSSGKVDRAALKAIKNDTERVPPKTDNEISILNAVTEELAKLDPDVNIGVTDDLFSAGLDSLTALSLMLKLREAGFDTGVQDIYANPTVRMLAEKVNRAAMLVPLGEQRGGGSVMCCFPYAGGQPQAFLKAAEQSEADTLGVNYDYFDESLTVEDIAEAVAAALEKYDDIRLLSSCTGSAAALETAARLEKRGKNVSALYITASVPTVGVDPRNPWRRAGKRMTEKIVSRSLNLPDGFDTDSFLRDTDRFFAYMARHMPRLNAKGYIAFADKDVFTRGSRRNRERWQRYFKNKCVMTVFHTNDHYFVSSTDDLLRKMEGGGTL